MPSENKTISRFTARRERWRDLGEMLPRFSVGFDSYSSSKDDYYLSLPFKRSLIALIISAAFLFGFSIPLFSIGSEIGGSTDGSLFSLVFVLFSLFWMLGWSTGVAVLVVIFLLLAFGRETLRVRDRNLVLRVGLFGIGFGAHYPAQLIRNFREQSPDQKTGSSWRGEHLAFDYAGETIEFGSALQPQLAEKILTELRQLFPGHQQPLPDLSTFAASAGALDETAPISVSDEAAVEMAGIETGDALRLGSVSSLALLTANLIPLLGVLFDDWSIFEIMLLFWAESAVIGIYNLCKIWKIGRWAVLFYGPFFVGHYGGFMAVHLLFIYGIFGSGLLGDGDISTTQMFQDFGRLAPVLIVFFISHGISYFSNFIGKHEYRGKQTAQQMGEPYRRIIIMHVTIIFGGFLVMAFDSAVPALSLLILLKAIADLRGHLAQHSPQKA